MTTRPMKTLTLPVNGENVTYTIEPEDGSITTEKVEDKAITAPKINQSLWDKLLVSEETSGNPASFSDGADDVPVNSLKVALSPVQDLHGYDYPWVGGAGKNLIKPAFTSKTTVSGITITPTPAGVKVSGTPTGRYALSLNAYGVTEHIDLTTGEQVTFSLYVKGSIANAETPFIGYYKTGNAYGGNVGNVTPSEPRTWTVPSNYGDATDSYIRAYVYLNVGETYDFEIGLQCERGSSASAYQPYENICPIIAANGKNLFDKDNANILNAYITGGNSTIQASAVDRMVYIPILANQQFSVTFTQKALSTATQSDDTQIGLFDSTPVTGLVGTRVYTATRTAPTADMKVTYTGSTDGHTWLALKIGNVNRTDITASMATLQIEYGNATAYQPYQGISVERAGINLFDASVANHGKRWKSTGLETMSNVSASAKIPCFPNTQYYLHDVAGENNGVPAVYFWDVDNTYISNVVIQGTSPVSQMITTPANAAYMGINYMTAQESTVGVNCNGVTDFVPYVGTSYPYTLGQTVYGGTVDLATGVLTVTMAIVDLGTLNWTVTNHATLGQYFYADVRPLGIKYEGSYVSTVYTALCTSYTVVKRDVATFVDYTYCMDGSTGSVVQVQFKNSSYTTAADFKASVSGVQMVYKLATPQTYQLTPTQVNTLLGYNNISSSGTVDVIYHADTKLYVDKMTAVDNAIIAPTEEGFTATRNYTVNDLVIVNDTLYKVTANIATGSAITPNSNVQQTTLGALIKALS